MTRFAPHARQIVETAVRKKQQVTCAESCTGGLLAAALTDVAGSSGMFERGFVTYSNAAKTDLLVVKSETLDQFGAVSEQVAKEMATGAKDAAQADIAVAITGIAGPGGSEHKPEGRVCFGLATNSGTITQTIDFSALGRGKVRLAARDHALSLILAALS